LCKYICFQSSVITKYVSFLKAFFNLDCHEKMQGCTQAPGLCQSHSCPSRMFCCHHNCSTIKRKVEANHSKLQQRIHKLDLIGILTIFFKLWTPTYFLTINDNWNFALMSKGTFLNQYQWMGEAWKKQQNLKKLLFPIKMQIFGL